MGRGGDTARTVWKAVGDVSGRPGSRAGLRRRGRADRSTRAKGLPARGTRRQPAPRPPRPVHGPRRPLAPAHSTSHDARSFAPKRTPLAAARWERARGAAGHRFRHTTLGSGSTGSGSESTRRCRTKPATSSAAAVPQHQAASSSTQRPHHHGNGGRTANSMARRKQPPPPLVPTRGGNRHRSGARGGHRRPVYEERRRAARWRGDRTEPSGTADGRASLSRFPPLEPGSGSSTSGAPTWPICPAAPAGLLMRGYKGKEAGRLGPPDASPAVPQLQADPDSGPYEGESGTFRLDKLLRLQHNIEV